MKRFTPILCIAAAFACSSNGADIDPLTDEEGALGSVTQEIKKGKPGAVNGAADYCNNPAALCLAGEGDCDYNSQCDTSVYPLICAANTGPLWGMPADYDVCQASYCKNGVKDGAETGTDCGGPCPSCAPVSQGSFRLGGANDDFLESMALSQVDGSYVLAGRFFGSAAFGGPTLTSNGDSDIFVVKYNAAGVHQWSRSFGNAKADGDHGVGVAIDDSGNVAVVGNMAETVDYGGGPRTSHGGYDGFLVKLSSAGAHVFSAVYGGTGLDKLHKVAFDAGGNVIVTGAYSATASFGGPSFTSQGSFDTITAKYSPTGAHVWSKSYGGPGNDQALNLAVDRDRHVLIVGYFGQTVAFGATSLVSAGGFDAFVARLTASTGATMYAKRYGGTGTDEAVGVAVDSSRQSVVTGFFRKTADFGGGPVTSVTADKGDAFVVGLTATGAYRFFDVFGGPDNDNAITAAIDSRTGGFAVGGYASGAISGLAPDGSVLTSAGGRDAFIAKYASSGAISSAALYGNATADSAVGLAIFEGKIRAAGTFYGSTAFGGPALNSAGGADVWLGQFAF